MSQETPSTSQMQGSTQQTPMGQMGQQAMQPTSQQSGQMGQQGTQAMGQQSGQSMGQQGGQTMGHEMRLSEVETPQQRQALLDVTEALKVCAFCADQCIQEADPNMVECIRLCEDVTELAATTLELVPRQSRQAMTVIQALGQAMEDCARECGRHQDGHCQECAEVLGQATQSIRQLEQTLLQ